MTPPTKKKRGRPLTRTAETVAEKAAEIPGGMDAEGAPELLFALVAGEVGARVRIQRLDDFSKKWILHGYLEMGKATEEEVYRLFGGGKYRLSKIAPNDQGLPVVQKTTTFELSGAYRRPQELPGIGDPKPVGEIGTLPVMGRPGQGATTAQLIDMALADKVLDMMRVQPRIDWAPIIVAFAPVVKELLSPRPRAEEPAGLGELRAHLASLTEKLDGLRNQPGPATNQIHDVADAIKAVLGIRKAVEGGADALPTDPMAAIANLADKLLSRGSTSRPSSPPPLPSPPGPDMTTLPEWQRLLVQHRSVLFNAARWGVEPSAAAELAVKSPGIRSAEGVLVEFLARPDADTVICQVVPELAQFPTWVRDVVTELRSYYAEPSDDPNEEV